jgi:small subunit ribosomal protein S20
MANTKSAKKMVRKITRKTAVNKVRKTQMRTHVKKVEEAIAAGDKAAAAVAFKAAEPQLAKSAQKGVIHQKTASRKVSRLAARVRAMA